MLGQGHEMKMLQVHGWEEWQSYRKDRGLPPWIKVQRNLQRNLKWIGMTDAERGQLLAIWLLAVEYNGRIPGCAATIMKLCYMTEPPNLERFISSGWLDNTSKSRKTKGSRDNQLTTNFQPTSANLTPQISDTDTEAEEEEESPLTPQGGGVVVLHETRIEKPKPKPTLVVVIPDWLPREAWDNFRAHRQRLRRPMTAKAEQLAMRELEKLRASGNDPTAVIEQSIYRGWQGLFEITGSRNGTAKTISKAEQRDQRIRESSRKVAEYFGIHGDARAPGDERSGEGILDENFE